MKCLLLVIWTASQVMAFGSENDLLSSNAILLARQHFGNLNLPRRSLSRNTPPKSNTAARTRRPRTLLPRSGGPPQSGTGGRNLDRSGHQPTKSKASAQGAANLEILSNHGVKKMNVAEGQSRVLRDQHHNWAMVGAKSNVQPGGEGGVSAKLRGNTVLGLVTPAPGGTGKIKIKKDGNTRQIDVTNPEGEYHSEVSDRPGGVVLTASAGPGGHTRAVTLNENVDQRRQGSQPGQAS